VRTLPRPASSITQQQIVNTTEPVTVLPSEVRVEHHHEHTTVEHHHSDATTERLIEPERRTELQPRDQQQPRDEHHHHHQTERVERIADVERTRETAPASSRGVLPAPVAPKPPAGSGPPATELRETHERVVERETPGERIVEQHHATRERVIEREHENTIRPSERVIRERPGTRVIERILERTQTAFPAVPRAPVILEGPTAAERAMPEPEPPSIHVSIGRIEIRATPAAEPRPRAVTPRTSTLDDYLRRRDRGSR
jgi:hypothetical protein